MECRRVLFRSRGGGVEAAEVPAQQGVLVGRAGAGREPAVKLDGRIEAQRLDEDGAPAGAQHAGDLAEGAVDVEVVEDGKSVVEGKSVSVRVDQVVCGIIKKKTGLEGARNNKKYTQ